MGDFGCSSRRNTCDVQKLVGTPGFQAPEFLRSAGAAGPKCDVYSFGVTMWSAVAKTVPFQNVHPHTVIFKVVSCQMRPNSPPDAAAYSPFRSIYERCWRQGRDSIERKLASVLA